MQTEEDTIIEKVPYIVICTIHVMYSLTEVRNKNKSILGVYLALAIINEEVGGYLSILTDGM